MSNNLQGEYSQNIQPQITPKKSTIKEYVGYIAMCGLAIFAVVVVASVMFTTPEPQIAEASFDDKIENLNSDNAKLTEDNIKLQKSIDINNQKMTANNELIKVYELGK